MSSSNLTMEEKVKRARAKRRFKTITHIVCSVVGLAIAIPLLYITFQTVMFSVMPSLDSTSDKPMGQGFSRPLVVVQQDDDKEYVLAYHKDGWWHVVDDTYEIKKNKDKFIVYKSDDKWREGNKNELYVFRGTECLIHTSLSSFTMIYSDLFKNCEKKMSMDEFEAYCNEKGFAGVYAFDRNRSAEAAKEAQIIDDDD